VVGVVDGDGGDDKRRGASADVFLVVGLRSLWLLTLPLRSSAPLPPLTVVVVVVVAALVVVAVGGGGGEGLYNPRSLNRRSRRATVLLLPVPAAAGS
jgi:hypothetical protein